MAKRYLSKRRVRKATRKNTRKRGRKMVGGNIEIKVYYNADFLENTTWRGFNSKHKGKSFEDVYKSIFPNIIELQVREFNRKISSCRSICTKELSIPDDYTDFILVTAEKDGDIHGFMILTWDYSNNDEIKIELLCTSKNSQDKKMKIGKSLINFIKSKGKKISLQDVASVPDFYEKLGFDCQRSSGWGTTVCRYTPP